jgi:hypothetical protein
MFRLALVAIQVLVLCSADLPSAFKLGFQKNTTVEFPAGISLPVLPDLAERQDSPKARKKNEPLTAEQRLALLRYVSGEFAKALKPLPGGKQGLRMKVGEPLNQQMLDRAVATHGAAVNTGDSVQVTHLEFKDREILVDVNGGGHVKKRLRDRLHVEVGGMPTVRATQPDQPPGIRGGAGSTIELDFGKPVPEMTPDELKQLLAPILDFSKQRSAAVHWVDTLPPEMKKAIEEKRAVVGMDREMVVAAVGKPERKVRERDDDGNEIEDWIYGEPPGKTMFVRFMGERVTRIKSFPQ